MRPRMLRPRRTRWILIHFEVDSDTVRNSFFKPLDMVSPQARESEDPVEEGERALSAALEPDLADEPHIVLPDFGVGQHLVQ